jgi:hypothetical protein
LKGDSAAITDASIQTMHRLVHEARMEFPSIGERFLVDAAVPAGKEINAPFERQQLLIATSEFSID